MSDERGAERDRAIRERAYALWEKSGNRHGQHGEHWDQAVREIDAEAKSGRPKAARKTAVTRAKAKPGPKPKGAAASSTKSVGATKPRTAAAPKTAKPGPSSPPLATTAVGKAKQAADKVVATVKRATKGTTKS